MTSPDGITWTTQNPIGFNNYGWDGIVWSPELQLFCAVAENASSHELIMTSKNGILWGNHPVFSRYSHDLTSVCWSPQLMKFCAVADDGSDNYSVLRTL
jgi:hypothetical protein